MTLYKQLFFSMLFVLLCVSSVSWMGECKRTRDFLNEQMNTHAQDSATFLGLSLSSIKSDSGLATMTAMINALFDRGYYRLIELRDVQGNVLVARHAETPPLQVPAWFTRLVALTPPEATAMVMHGWQQAGIIQVESHLDNAYHTLWQAAQTTALWFSMACVAFAVLSGLLLRSVLRPLARIEGQAVALCNRQFEIQEHIPRTRELRRVVLAMNTMTERLSRLFHEQVALADTLHKQVYQDSLTGIGNRRYLETQVNAQFAEKGINIQGVFFIFQIQDLKAINDQGGYQQGDRIIKKTSAALHKGCHPFPAGILARLGGGDFALFLPDVDEQTARHVAADILEDMEQQEAMKLSATLPVRLVSGGVFFERVVSLNELLAQADTALRIARQGGDQKGHLLALTDAPAPPVPGKGRWKEVLLDVLANKNITFYAQPAVRCTNLSEPVHYELFARIVDSSGEHLSLGSFVAMAKEHDLMAELDRMVLEEVFAQPMESFAPHRVTLNVSPLSLKNHEFITWLRQRLEHCSRNGLFFNFEFPEYRLVKYGKRVKGFADEIRRYGHGIGIDHFGQGMIHFDYLQWLMPDYVKLDRAITNEVADDGVALDFFINTLCTVAHSIGVQVIIKNIETEEQWKTFAPLHIDAVQGFYIQPPKPFSAFCCQEKGGNGERSGEPMDVEEGE